MDTSKHSECNNGQPVFQHNRKKGQMGKEEAVLTSRMQRTELAGPGHGWCIRVR